MVEPRGVRLAFGGAHQMGQQQRVGKWTDPAGDRRYRGGHVHGRLEVDVAHDPPIDDVDPDIDDHGAGLQHRAGDQARMAGRHDHDVGTADLRRQVPRPRVTDGDGRVLLDQQERRRHPDDRRAPDDDGVAARDLDPGAAQDLDRGVGGRGQEAVVAEPEQTGVQRVDPVDVLGRIDGVDDRSQPDRRRERHLDDDAIDRRIVVELADRRDDRRLGRFALEFDERGVDADLRAAAQDLLEVDRRGRVAPDDDHGEPGRPAVGGRERRDVLGDGRPDLARRSAHPREAERRDGAIDQARAGAGIGSRGSPLPTASRVSEARRSTSWSSSSTRAVIASSNVRVPDRRQVDEDVGRGPVRRRLTEQRGDVEVAGGVDVAPAGECLGRSRSARRRPRTHEERDLAGVARRGPERHRAHGRAPRRCRAAASCAAA